MRGYVSVVAEIEMHGAPELPHVSHLQHLFLWSCVGYDLNTVYDRCVEIPESCADGIDEMIETTAIIKEEVRKEKLQNAEDSESRSNSSLQKGKLDKQSERPRVVVRANS